MQNGKAGSYFWARAGPAAEIDAIAKIAKAKRRIGTFLAIDGTASAHCNRPAMLIPINSPWRYPARMQRQLTGTSNSEQQQWSPGFDIRVSRAGG
jgi:hypothetical protein